MDTNTKLDFILTKTQRDAFIANWKHLHVSKTRLLAEDYLLYHLFKPAVSDIPRKAKQAFSPSKKYNTTIVSLKYRTKNQYPLPFASMSCTALSIDQYAKMFWVLYELCNDN